MVAGTFTAADFFAADFFAGDFLAAAFRGADFSAGLGAALELEASVLRSDAMSLRSDSMSSRVARPRLLIWVLISARTVSSRRSVFSRLRSTSSCTVLVACSAPTSPAPTRSRTIASARSWVIFVKATPASRKRLSMSV